MGSPITWQNINAPSLSDVSRSLAAAQQSFGGGVGSVQEALARRDAVEAANQQQMKLNNTADFVAAVNKYTTPEEFQAAQRSGALRDTLAQYGAQIDQATAAQYLDSRLGTLQQRGTAAIEFNKQKALDDNRDVLNQYAILGALGKTSDQAALLEKNPQINAWVNPSATSAGLVESRAAAQEGRTQETHAKDLQFKDAQIVDIPKAAQDRRTQALASATQAAASAAQVPIHQQQADTALLGVLTQASHAAAQMRIAVGQDNKQYDRLKEQAQYTIKNGVFGAGVVGTPEGNDYVLKSMNDDKRFSDADRSAAAALLAKIGANGGIRLTIRDSKGNVIPDKNGEPQTEIVPVPASTVVEKLLDARGAWKEHLWSTDGSTAFKALTKQFDNPEYLNRYKEGLAAHSFLSGNQGMPRTPGKADFAQDTASLRSAIPTPSVSVSAKVGQTTNPFTALDSSLIPTPEQAASNPEFSKTSSIVEALRRARARGEVVQKGLGNRLDAINPDVTQFTR